MMTDIRSLCDCPLLDEVEFYQDEKEIDINDNTKEKEKEYKGDYRKQSPNELGLIYVATRKDSDFTKLYNVIKRTLYKNIIRMVGTNRDDIETVVDTTMLYVYRNIEKFDINKSNFCVWVHGIAKNAARNYINRSGMKNNNVYSTDFSDLYDSSVMLDDSDSVADTNISPSYVSEDEGFVDIVYNNGVYTVYTIEDVLSNFFDSIQLCINKMPDIKKQTFKERFINNRTIKDTADVVGVSGTSVKRYYAEGKCNIIDYLKKKRPELYNMMKDIY